jgi:hypothetical protein
MNKLFWNTVKAAPLVFAASLLTANGVVAQNLSTNETLKQVESYQGQGNSDSPMSQVTNVNQLRDVSPTDWAYEALRSLVDRYGCIAGFPNQTYRGNQALSRYEFAAGLNSCLSQIERLIASSESVVREDIDTINRLTQEFEAELATLGGRVDNLESRTAFLEDHQFSTTTKLKGEVIFAIADTFGDIGQDDPTETTFSDRVRLNLDTSFTGEDLLTTRLQAGNVPNLDDETGFDASRLGFDEDNGNDIVIDNLYYRFPVGERITAFVGANGLDLDDVFNVTNPLLESSGTGALSRFNRRNPLTFRGPEGVGAAVKFDLIPDKLSITGTYLTDNGETDDDGTGIGASAPTEGNGLFNGSYSAGGQIAFTPSENLELAATYVRSYQTEGNVNLTGSTGSDNAQDPFSGVATNADRFGLGANYLLGERLNLGLWGGLAFASPTSNNENVDANLFTVAANVSLLDVLKEGSVLSVAGGIPPKIYSSENAANDPDTSFLVEGLYKFPLNDNIFITPGVFVLFNPEHNTANDTQFVGVLRTTFKF